MTKEYLIQLGKGVCDKNSYLNCQLFTQLVSNTNKIFELPQIDLDEIKMGDVLVWDRDVGTNSPPRHYSIYLGDGDVMEIAEWGEDMRIIPLQDSLEEYEAFEAFRPNWYIRESKFYNFLKNII